MFQVFLMSNGKIGLDHKKSHLCGDQIQGSINHLYPQSYFAVI